MIPWFIVLYWLTWWIGSQQMRFLYLPILLIFLVVTAELKNISKVLLVCVFIASVLNAVSVFRAHKDDFGTSMETMLRTKDLELIKLSREYEAQGRRDPVDMVYGDVAYARFPVRVVKPKFPYILEL